MEGIYTFIIKSLLVSGIMTAYYWFVLRNKKFHYYNRFYLIGSMLLSILVPFADFKWYAVPQPASVSAQQMMQLIGQPGRIVITDSAFTWERIFFYAVATVSLLLLLGMARGIYRIFQIKQQSRVSKLGEIDFIETTHQDAPFSFFSNLFWQKGVSLDGATGSQVFRHELTHIEQRHTHDKLFVGLVTSLFWMNPFFWIIRNELQVIHEFIADEKAIDEADASALAAMLLHTHFQENFFNTEASFFYSSIKRRLFMLSHSKKTSFSYLRRMLVLPIAVAMLLLLSFTITEKNAVPGSLSVLPEEQSQPLSKSVLDTIPHKYLTADGKGLKGSFLVDMHGDAAVFMDPKTKQVLFAVPVSQMIQSNNATTSIRKKQAAAFSSMTIPFDTLVSFVGDTTTKITRLVFESHVDTTVDKDVKAELFTKENSRVIVVKGYKLDDKTIDSGKILVEATRIAGANGTGDKQVVYFQGNSTKIAGTSNGMLFVVDGKVVGQEEMSAIPPSKIQSIKVLKGEAAVKSYGESASGGVVEITLKK